MSGPETQLLESFVFPSQVFIPNLSPKLPQRLWTGFQHHICGSYWAPKERKAPLPLSCPPRFTPASSLSNTPALLLPSLQVLHALVHVILDVSSKAQIQTSFCRRRDLLKGCQGAPRHRTWGGRDRNSSGGLRASPDWTPLTSYDCLSLLVGFVPSVQLSREEEPGPPAAPGSHLPALY